MKNKTIIATLLLSLPVAGCVYKDGPAGPITSVPPKPSFDTLTIEIGPCFGFCPVYKVTIGPDGNVTFDGQRHTAILGIRHRQVDNDTRRIIVATLAPYRPLAGETVRIACDAAVTDTPSYTITWTDKSGTRTTAIHQAGCPGGKGHDLDAILRDLPERLGIQEWAKQLTRPGASRG